MGDCTWQLGRGKVMSFVGGRERHTDRGSADPILCLMRCISSKERDAATGERGLITSPQQEIWFSIRGQI